MKKLLLISCALITISACTPTHDVRGNLLEEYQLEKIKIGQDNTGTVLKKLGSPTTKDPFNDNRWYYLGQEIEKHGILDPEVASEQIIVVSFNNDGVVTNIQDVENERLELPYARRKTPTAGNELTAFQQFLGNLGKFNRE